jgi:hypothetical protein
MVRVERTAGDATVRVAAARANKAVKVFIVGWTEDVMRQLRKIHGKADGFIRRTKLRTESR